MELVGMESESSGFLYVEVESNKNKGNIGSELKQKNIKNGGKKEEEKQTNGCICDDDDGIGIGIWLYGTHIREQNNTKYNRVYTILIYTQHTVRSTSASTANRDTHLLYPSCTCECDTRSFGEEREPNSISKSITIHISTLHWVLSILSNIHT